MPPFTASESIPNSSAVIASQYSSLLSALASGVRAAPLSKPPAANVATSTNPKRRAAWISSIPVVRANPSQPF